MTKPRTEEETQTLLRSIAVARATVKLGKTPSDGEVAAELKEMRGDTLYRGVKFIPDMTPTEAVAYLKSVGSPVPVAPKK